MSRHIVFVFCLVLLANLPTYALRPPVLTTGRMKKAPPKIIRTCCAFGYELKIAGVPCKRISEITERKAIGPHFFLGDAREANGIIYTHLGGFIDLGHLRDVADWTGYLYVQIQQAKGQPVTLSLGHEGGKKTLSLHVPADLPDSDAAALAARIAYELSLWHEIGTWYGTSYIPFVPERYSAFSPEDQYSNLLGARLGLRAVLSAQRFEASMTRLLDSTLTRLGAVSTRAETVAAMERVKNDWWTSNKRLPSKKVLIRRFVVPGDTLQPWTLPEENRSPVVLTVPAATARLQNMYELRFSLNRKIPFREIFPGREERCVTSDDFPVIMKYIQAAVTQLEMAVQSELAAAEVKKKKKALRRRRRSAL